MRSDAPPQRAPGVPGRLLFWLWGAQWQAQPGRMLLATLAIAIGVALALGIHLVNRSALTEFAASIAQVNGEAQAQLIGRAGDLDESLLELVGSTPGVAVASPVIDARWTLVHPPPEPSSDRARPARALRIIGLDPLRAGSVTPALMPSPSESNAPGLASALFADDSIFLSRAAMTEFGLKVGDRLGLLAGERIVSLTVRGGIVAGHGGQSLAVMDIGTLQWRLGSMGRLTRIDLSFEADAPIASVRQTIESRLPKGVLWSSPQAGVQRMSNLSRAYRVNLNVLALVALFTGVFIVHAALALLVVRQSGQLALLSVLGAPRSMPAMYIGVTAALMGLVGGLLGIVGAIALARLMLSLTRGDLGGGYFSGQGSALEIDAIAVIVALVGGLVAALAGALGPMRATLRLQPAIALRGAGDETLLNHRWTLRGAIGLAAGGVCLLALPPIQGLPIAAYIAIAFFLLAGILASPALLAPLVRRWADSAIAQRTGVMPWLALQRVAATPGQTATAFAGVIASIALASAMAIMVTSFRTSVEQWLEQVLPADLYGRAGYTDRTATIGRTTQTQLAGLPGVLRARFTRQIPLLLDPAKPPVTLIARDWNAENPARSLPLTGPVREAPPGAVTAWVTEAVVDLYGLRPGDWTELPIGAANTPLKVFISGVWRDYSRQFGAIMIDRDAYIRHTGDEDANEVAWWLAPGTDPDAMVRRLAELSPVTGALELRETTALKALSMRIFDRSFAVTYALEAIAIAVALFGAASSRAAEALSRQREFGMLLHLGWTRTPIARAFALEGGVGALLACLWGLTLGAIVAAILVHRVNPQSFHWTMSMHWPWGLLAVSVGATVLFAALAARWVAHQALGTGPLAAVRADW
ncbi:MAG: hypothetical protein RL322_2877 [Pseudomonadota bacterium]